MPATALQQEFIETAKIVGHVELPKQEELSLPTAPLDDFLAQQAAAPWEQSSVQRDYDRLRAEIAELKTENRWDVARGRYSQAVQILEKSAERDRRSRHKSLIRVARICISVAEYEKGMDAAHRADMFCSNTYGNGIKGSSVLVGGSFVSVGTL